MKKKVEKMEERIKDLESEVFRLKKEVEKKEAKEIHHHYHYPVYPQPVTPWYYRRQPPWEITSGDDGYISETATTSGTNIEEIRWNSGGKSRI